MIPSKTAKLDVEKLRKWIGHEEQVSDVITTDLIRKFYATFDLEEPVPEMGQTAPRLIHFCLAQATAPTVALGTDGHPRKGHFLPPVPLPRRMWAAGRMNFRKDLRVGDEVRRVSRIADVVPKNGRGGLLCFVTVEHVIGVDGNAVVNETQDIVYRSMDEGASSKPGEPAKPGNEQRRIQPSPQLLFRYSALTFNSHRIHYDRRFVAEVKQYPGLVVHGPLQATLLANFATKIHGAMPSSFNFRSVSPLFDYDPFILHAEEDGSKLKLWTAREGGPVAMMAEASWA
jgi:3-methylfumaryl-CoA hydratase